MKVVELLNFKKEHGDLRISEIIEMMDRPFVCPKCEGKGTDAIKHRRYVQDRDKRPVYTFVECSLCEGHGYTEKKLRPKYRTELIGYE